MAEGKIGKEVLQKLISLTPSEGKGGWLDQKVIIYDPDSAEQMEVQTVVCDSRQQMTLIIKRN